MKIYNEIHANTDKWESGELGATQEFVKVSEFTAKDLQKSIELQPISLRVNKDLLEDLKSLAKMHNIGYQPLMKQILKRFVDAEKRRLANEYISELNSRALEEDTAEDELNEQVKIAL